MVGLEHLCVRRLSDTPTTWLTFIRFAGAAPILALSAISGGVPFPRWTSVAMIVAVLVPLEASIGWLQMTAIQQGEQSSIGPLYGLSILFLVPLGWMILGELPSTGGLISALSVLAGALLVAGPGLITVPGSAASRMAGAALAGALAVTITRWLLVDETRTHPLVLAAISYAGAAAFSVPRPSQIRAPSHTIWLLGLGLAFIGAAVFHFYGLSLAPAAYVIAAKRSSIAWDVGFGWLSGESQTRWKIIGASLIFGGCIGFYLIG